MARVNIRRESRDAGERSGLTSVEMDRLLKRQKKLDVGIDGRIYYGKAPAPEPEVEIELADLDAREDLGNDDEEEVVETKVEPIIVKVPKRTKKPKKKDSSKRFKRD
jgi:hypothetical protein